MEGEGHLGQLLLFKPQARSLEQYVDRGRLEGKGLLVPGQGERERVRARVIGVGLG